MVGSEEESEVVEDVGIRKVDRPLGVVIAQIGQSYRYIDTGPAP